MKTAVLCTRRKAFLAYVDLDPTPGTFHTPFSAWECIQAILKEALAAYHPTAILVTEHPHINENNGRQRVCFMILVDLDPLPGSFHTQESAQNWVGLTLRRAIPHYNPIVSLAPASVQPYTLVEGNVHA